MWRTRTSSVAPPPRTLGTAKNPCLMMWWIWEWLPPKYRRSVPPGGLAYASAGSAGAPGVPRHAARYASYWNWENSL